MKKITSLLLALLMVISMAACGSQDAGKEPANDNGDGTTTFNNVKISAGSGTSGGGQYVYVGGISSIINTHLDGVEVILEATKGSGENLSLLQNGDLEIASIESSIAYNAMMGIDLGEGESAFPEIRCLFASLPTYFIMTTLHVVAGELIPKSMAILKTETYALHTAGPLHAFYRITYPIMWLFNATTNGVMRLTGHDAKNETEAYSEEEIKLLLEESAESGSIEQDQYQYLDNIFDLDDKDAKAIMTPRTEVLAIDYDDDLETNLDFMGKNKFTRYPVFREDKDNIVGFVHIKDAYLLPEGSTMKDLKIRSIQAVPESISIAKLLQVLQAKHTKIAVVVDEHGGTSGIVTMTDVVEQIIGRMEDEYLHDDQDEILKVGEHHYLVDGSLPVDQFVEFIGFEPVPVFDYETAGGLMLDLLDKIPAEGDSYELHHEGTKITMMARVMDGLRIDKIDVRFEEEPETVEGEEKE